MSTFFGRNKLSSSLLLTASLLLAAGTARADIITIDFNTIIPKVDSLNVTTFTIDGFVLTASVGTFSVKAFGGGLPPSNFLLAIGNPTVFPTVTFQRMGGGVFDLISLFEVADLDGDFGGLGALVLTTNLGGSKDMYFQVPNIPFPANFSASLPGFAGITTMTWTQHTSDGQAGFNPISVCVDGVTLCSADLPEPGGFGLLALGFAGLAALRRYRRQV